MTGGVLPRPLRVAFDATPLAERRPTGVARALCGWVSGLLATSHPVRVTLVVPGDVGFELELRTGGDLDVVRLPPGPGFRPVHLPRALRRLRPDVFHSPFLALPPRTGIPRVVTLHEVPDASTVFFRAEGVWRTLRQRAWWTIAGRWAEGAVAVSLHTARAARRAGWTGTPLHVIPHGVDRVATRVAPFPRTGPLVAVSTIRAKKGVELALAAHARVLGARRSPRQGPELVWIGDGDPPRAGPGVRFAGYLSDAEVRRILTRAGCLLVPSMTEGFGLPALEAMAAGCPVVVSNAGALPEVVGRAGWIVPRATAEAWSAVLETVLSGGDEVARRAERGLRRSKRFTWKRAASRLLRLYAEVLVGEKG